MDSSKYWYKDNIMISTNNQLLQPDAINEVMNSDIMWWARELSPELLKKMLDNTLCFGVYDTLPNASTDYPERKQIGLARIITDNVTFAYMTDVYILPAYQGKGLGALLMKCVNEVLESWPMLRGFMLICGESEEKFYEKMFGMEILRSINGHGVRPMVKNGPGR